MGAPIAQLLLNCHSTASHRRAQVDSQRGWVTLVKSGEELVAQRPRLNASERQQALELWRSREAMDRSVKALQGPAGEGKKVSQSFLHVRGHYTRISTLRWGMHALSDTRMHHTDAKQGTHVGPCLAHELGADEMGIGFAFGGVHPG